MVKRRSLLLREQKTENEMAKGGLQSVVQTNAKFGVTILKRSDIPAPIGSGRAAIVPQLTIAKILVESLKRIAENGLSVAEEACAFDLGSPATKQEAQA